MSTVSELLAELRSAEDAYAWAKSKLGALGVLNGDGAPIWAELVRAGVPAADVVRLQAMAANGATPADDSGFIPAEDEEDTPDPSPLESDARGFDLALPWVDDYAMVMASLTASPVEFNRLVGLVLVATAIQRRGRLRMAFGDVYPNIYGAIVAPPAVFHKSSSLSRGRNLMHQAGLDKLLLSELMTSEGLLQQLQGQPAGLVIRDEIGTLFDSHNTKYLRNLKPDLTALFDCAPYSRRLAAMEIKVDAPYLNILGATTPARFYEGITFTDMQDGFVSRWLFVTPEGEPDFDAPARMLGDEDRAALAELADTLMQIDRQQMTDFVLQDDAFDLWDTWRRDAARAAYAYGDDAVASIVTRYGTYALKFSIILAAAGGSWGTITADTMRTSIGLADYFKASVNRLLSQKSNFGVSGAKLQKVFAVIRRYPDTGTTTKEVYQHANMNRGEARPVLEKLIEIGAIRNEKAGRGERFFPAAEKLPVRAW